MKEIFDWIKKFMRMDSLGSFIVMLAICLFFVLMVYRLLFT